jgi:hypothetical protein
MNRHDGSVRSRCKVGRAPVHVRPEAAFIECCGDRMQRADAGEVEVELLAVRLVSGRGLSSRWVGGVMGAARKCDISHAAQVSAQAMQTFCGAV